MSLAPELLGGPRMARPSPEMHFGADEGGRRQKAKKAKGAAGGFGKK